MIRTLQFTSPGNAQYTKTRTKLWIIIASGPPKMAYKSKSHMKESQVLNSLFREDTEKEHMEPPSKE